MTGVANVRGNLELGDGVQFWAYISPQNETSKYVTKREVRLEQQDGNWTGSINSDDPTKMLQTPGLSGIFMVTNKSAEDNPSLNDKVILNDKLSPALNSLLIQAVNADLRISIARDRNNTKESCKKNPLSLVNGDELPEQSWSMGTSRKKTAEEIDAETAGGARGCPMFMAVAE